MAYIDIKKEIALASHLVFSTMGRNLEVNRHCLEIPDEKSEEPCAQIAPCLSPCWMRFVKPR